MNLCVRVHGWANKVDALDQSRRREVSDAKNEKTNRKSFARVFLAREQKARGEGEARG